MEDNMAKYTYNFKFNNNSLEKILEEIITNILKNNAI